MSTSCRIIEYLHSKNEYTSSRFVKSLSCRIRTCLNLAMIDQLVVNYYLLCYVPPPQRELLIGPSVGLYLLQLLTDGQVDILFYQRDFPIRPSVSMSLSAFSFDGWTDGNIIRSKGVANWFNH